MKPRALDMYDGISCLANDTFDVRLLAYCAQARSGYRLVGAAVAACAQGDASLGPRGNALRAVKCDAPCCGCPGWLRAAPQWLPLVEREWPWLGSAVAGPTGAGAVAESGVLPDASGVRLPDRERDD